MPKLKPLRLVLAGVDKVSAPILKIRRNIDDLTRPIRRVQNQFRQLDRATGFRNLRRSIRSIGSSAARMTRRVGLAAAAAASVTAFAAKRFVDFGADLKRTAQTIGITTRELQELRFVGEQFGITGDEMDDTLRELSQRMGELHAGEGELIGILEKAAPALLKQFRGAKNTSEAFEILLNGMRNLTNQSDRLALANAAGGSSGLKLTRIAQEQRGELERLRETFHALGAEISDETLEGTVQASREFSKLETILDTTAAKIGAALLPTIEHITKGIEAWTDKNRDWLQVDLPKRIDEFVKSTEGALGAIGEFAKSVGGWKPVLITIGGLIAAVVVAPIIAAIGAIVGVVATITGLPALAVVALGFVAAKIATELGPISEWIDEVSEKVSNFVSSLSLGGALDGIRGFLGFDAAQPAAQASPVLSGGVVPHLAGAGRLEARTRSELKVEISQERPPRVVSVGGDLSEEFLDVYTGYTLGGLGS